MSFGIRGKSFRYSASKPYGSVCALSKVRMPSEVIRYGERKPFSYVHGTVRGDRWRGSQFLNADPYVTPMQNQYSQPYYVVHHTAFGTISRDAGSRLNLESIASSMHNVAAAGSHMIDLWRTVCFHCFFTYSKYSAFRMSHTRPSVRIVRDNDKF